MSDTHSPRVPRRGFLVRLSQATAALTALLADTRRLEAASVPATAINTREAHHSVPRTGG